MNDTQQNITQDRELMKQFAAAKFYDYFPFMKRKLRQFLPKHIFVKGEFDLTFFILVISLLFVGLVMVFSSSYIMALNDSTIGNDPYHYIYKQIMFSAAGIIVMLIISKIKQDFIREFSVFVLVVSAVLLIVVLFWHTTLPGREGVKRYIDVFGLFQFQPSEIAKLGIVMFMAWGMERNRKTIEKRARMLYPYIIAIFLFTVLIALEHHLSGTVLMLCIGIGMLFLSGAKLKWFIGFGILAVIGAAAGIYCFWLIANKPDEAARFLPAGIADWGKNPGGAPYTAVRIIAWLNKDFQPLDARWQINNSLYAIASGGVFGKGIGNSLQKHLYLSEAHNDFIFSIICEELGFAGAMIVIILFGLLIWRGFYIAKKSKDRFGSLLALGIIFQVGLQAAIHIAVVTDTIPNTGISLPFISYGGTSLIILLAEMGIVLSVSRTAKMKKS